MIDISLCMIVKNEAAVLGRCLRSVRGLVDEIVVVDTGSTDATREIAALHGAKVFDFPWVDDFSAARNYAFSKAARPYCMWLDADDVVEEPDRAAFLELKRTLDGSVDVVMLPYHVAFDEAGAPTFTYERERILRNSPAFRWAGAVHEAIAPAGKIVHGTAAVSHRKLGPGDPDRNLRIYEGELALGKTLSPRAQFYYARELTYHGRDEEAAAAFTAFLDGGEGWVENNIQACRDLFACDRRLGREAAAVEALFRSLRYGLPRSEVCCDAGGWFFDRGDYRTAAFWYELALTDREVAGEGAFVTPESHGFTPAIQLCVCWFRLGDMDRAKTYNDLAEQYRPGNEASAYNRRFFDAD